MQLEVRKPKRTRGARKVGDAHVDRQRALLEGRAPPPEEGEEKIASLSAVDVRNGVSVAWLAAVMGRSGEWVRKRLVDCPPARQNGRAFYYDIKIAMPYLVEPKIDLETYLSSLKSTDLPATLQSEMWNARLRRQKWEANAGELWHTQDVLNVLSTTMALIKSNIQLWPDTVERQTGLSDLQRKLLVQLGDTLQDEIHQSLITASKGSKTRSSLADLDRERAEKEAAEAAIPPFDDDDDPVEDDDFGGVL